MKTLTTDELIDLKQRSNVPLINVLAEDQFREAHIPGSENIPLGSNDFLHRVEQRVGDKSKEVVVYCASTECNASPKAGKVLEEAGFHNVYDYEGGTKAWQESGHEVATSK